MVAAPAGLLDDLAEVVDGRVRPAARDDHVAGARPAVVASPTSTEQVAALVRRCHERDLALTVRGRGTALHWGAPPRRLDVLLDVGGLDRVVEHAAGDLIAVVEAGVTLDALNAEVAGAGQQLALDQPRPGASIGGTLSTGRCGPRRVQFGAPRDLVLGVTVVRADGVIARAGSKVVKNVAGYDLAKLVTGAYGTLAVITRATVRLHPLPPASVWLALSCPGPAQAARHAVRLAGSQLAPTAVEVRRAPQAGDVEVLVLLEGTERGVAERVDQVRTLLDAPMRETRPERPEQLPGGADDVLVKAAVPIGGVGRLLDAVVAAERRHGLPLEVRGSAGVGVLHVAAPADAAPDAVAGLLADLRTACTDGGTDGSAVLLQAPAAVRERVDAWGPVPGLDLMRRVKDQYDPQGLLAPGRFVGGI